MHRFKLWAPVPDRVEVECDGARVPMHKTEGGWWQADVDAAEPGSAYGFVLDGKSPLLPDPRSPYQPNGINGPSCVVDQNAFEWTDRHWQAKPLPSAVIYELHIGTFTPEGTFDSAIANLDYLADLGVTHVELMPVNEFSGKWGWGYDGVDLYAPHHAYGGPEGLKRFVNAAHARGLAAILDVVYNHLGPAGNYLSRFAPYFTARHRTPWGEAVNLDGAHCHEVRRFFIDNALMWLRDYHFDGLRIDAVHALIDSGATHFLEELSEQVDKLGIGIGRHFVLIAESDLNDPRIVRSREMAGFGMHAQWSDDFHHALHNVLTGESAGYYADFHGVEHLAKSIRDVFVYDGCFSPHRERPHGRPVRLLPGYHFLGYIQNHDQIGNRAAGDRISHLAGSRKAMLAAGLVLTSPFVPMLFQGEEWAASSPFQYFTQHEDRALGEAVSDGRRSEFVAFGWKKEEVPDPQDPATFHRSKLRWEETAERPHAEVLAWHKELIRLRRSHSSLADGSMERMNVRWGSEPAWIQYDRGPLTISCNFSDQPVSLTVSRPGAVIAKCGEAQMSGEQLQLGPLTFAITDASP